MDVTGWLPAKARTGPGMVAVGTKALLPWQGGRVHAAVFILYVADQARARNFYRHVLAAESVLDVPGMWTKR